MGPVDIPNPLWHVLNLKYKSVQLESVPSLQRHTAALGLWSLEILLLHWGKPCCYQPDPGRFKDSKQGT